MTGTPVPRAFVHPEGLQRQWQLPTHPRTVSTGFPAPQESQHMSQPTRKPALASLAQLWPGPCPPQSQTGAQSTHRGVSNREGRVKPAPPTPLCKNLLQEMRTSRDLGPELTKSSTLSLLRPRWPWESPDWKRPEPGDPGVQQGEEGEHLEDIPKAAQQGAPLQRASDTPESWP